MLIELGLDRTLAFFSIKYTHSDELSKYLNIFSVIDNLVKKKRNKETEC